MGISERIRGDLALIAAHKSTNLAYYWGYVRALAENGLVAGDEVAEIKKGDFWYVETCTSYSPLVFFGPYPSGYDALSPILAAGLSVSGNSVMVKIITGDEFEERRLELEERGMPLLIAPRDEYIPHRPAFFGDMVRRLFPHFDERTEGLKRAAEEPDTRIPEECPSCGFAWKRKFHDGWVLCGHCAAMWRPR